MDLLTEALSGARVEDDELRYRLHVHPTPTAACWWEAAAAAFMFTIKDDLSDVLWQKDTFNISKIEAEDGVTFLSGSVRFGDSVDDEWFAVYLLRKLTEIYPDLIVSVTDTDGELLLIETAHVLPDWLTPDTSVNRVVLHKGLLHIINESAAPLDQPLCLASALVIVSDDTIDTAASPNAQQLLSKRLAGYPQLMHRNKHRVNCWIPAAVASILEQDMQLVGAAVDAFHTRDTLDEKTMIRMKHIEPTCGVYAQVQMTRCMYAQLQQLDRFAIPSAFGLKLTQKDPRYQSHFIGAKLACGFEILCMRARPNRAASPLDVNISESEWNPCKLQLQLRGYFEGVQAGSDEYNKRLRHARQVYSCLLSNQEPHEEFDEAGSRVLAILDSGPFDAKAFVKAHETSLDALPPNDSDAWLTITTEQLTDMWNERGIQTGLDGQTMHNAMADMKTYVTQMQSDVEGVETPYDVGLDAQGFMDSLGALLSGDLNDLNDFLSSDEEDESEEPMSVDMEQYYAELDDELKDTKAAEGFVTQSDVRKLAETQSEQAGKDVGDEELNLDINLVQNLLSSLSAQEDMVGPVSQLLGALGYYDKGTSDE